MKRSREYREVKMSYCVLAAAYVILGSVLLIWPDISVRTFCYVFGVGMLIFGLAHLILYFIKEKRQSLMQMNMVAGVVGIATGAYILIKMEYMLEIIPFALGIVALLGAVAKIEHTLDLHSLGSTKWYIMLIVAFVLMALGALLVINPFEDITVIEKLIAVSLIIDGIGNLVGIFWSRYLLKTLDKPRKKKEYIRTVTADEVEEISADGQQPEAEEDTPESEKQTGMETGVSKVCVFPGDRSKK